MFDIIWYLGGGEVKKIASLCLNECSISVLCLYDWSITTLCLKKYDNATLFLNKCSTATLCSNNFKIATLCLNKYMCLTYCSILTIFQYCIKTVVLIGVFIAEIFLKRHWCLLIFLILSIKVTQKFEKYMKLFGTLEDTI